MFAAIGSGFVVGEVPGFAFQVKGDSKEAVAEQLTGWLNGLVTSHVKIFEKPVSQDSLITLKGMIEREFDSKADIVPLLISSL
ncbi:hypothetical protein ACFQDN_14670 [Pseudomonas asuensis]|uniref:Uncharacterized protein n=1 Tax=Pseudomonas asuensis TaxID=1825787 RepID=A0ABQ2GJD2_9PSED|nr:hypothetical protein [Pseudomonas asuensis]GGL99180.1 hypothetical protein GCM10009425_07880 [Pseudomonas asuensis]